jgi:hypothetical protein
MPLALIIFFIIGPAILVAIGLTIRSMKNKFVKDEGIIL